MEPHTRQYDEPPNRYNDWEKKSEEARLLSEKADEIRRQDLENQDQAVKDMWLRRYATTLPLHFPPIIEFQEPGPVKKLTQSATKILAPSSSVSDTASYSVQPSKLEYILVFASICYVLFHF